MVLQERPVEQTEDFLATLDGSTTADIRPQVSGIIEAVEYQEGGQVQVGQLLFRIDKRPFVAAVERARGDYQNAVAQHEKAQADVQRFTPLVERHAMSRQELDNARAAERIAAAAIQTARGALDAAKLNLEWTEVRSPIQGLAGIAQARVGSLVGPSQILAVVSTLDPIRATINIGEREYLQYSHAFNDAEEPRFADHHHFELLLVDGSTYSSTVTKVIVGRGINPATGTLTVQLLFPNPDRLLRPGMFAKVRAISGMVQALLVPERAVQELQGRYQVRVVDAQDRVEVRPVTLGPLVAHEYLVQQGLQAGERVVVEGQLGAEPGTKVTLQVLPPGALPGSATGGSGSGAGAGAAADAATSLSDAGR
jgi:membrane fusion protein (multidrug efflux system)